jgi:hypothetical protein
LLPYGYTFVVAYSWVDAAKAIGSHLGFTVDV